MVINNPTVYMFKTQVITVASFCSISTPWGPTFLFLVLPLRWFKNEVSGMFQYVATFHKEMCPFSTSSMASSRCWFVHLAYLVALDTLLVLVDLCISIMGGWHCCYVGVWTHCDCWVSCIVGVIGMIGYGGRLSYYAQMVPKCHFVISMAHSNVLQCTLLMVHP